MDLLPEVECSQLEKILKFCNDSTYKEITENTAKFNVRIRRDRVYRQPYIDGQTGIAQSHCQLFVSAKQRMPGILQGQVYTYPAKRWKSTHRSYLAMMQHQLPKPDPDEHTITTVENPAALVVPIEEPIVIDKSMQEPWVYYEEPSFEEDIDDFDSEEDLEDVTYRSKSKKKGGALGGGPRKGKTAGESPIVTGKKSSKKKKPENGGIQRAKKKPVSTVPKTPSKMPKIIIKKDEDDPKPYSCELCGMRYKTRPGLTYHYAHSHKESNEEEVATGVGVVSPAKLTPEGTSSTPYEAPLAFPSEMPPIPCDWAAAVATGRRAAAPTPGMLTESLVDKIANKKRVPPSPYCDFCLGDASVNKKTGTSENLVSCADCGRSGHPSCLQFTQNMLKSVLKYRWQCIECKTCTLCGTSENDDQLLFCDDCDRGYHLYCLSPPLSEPPEGEWSCSLCINEFHRKF